jgi:hypothetical protein
LPGDGVRAADAVFYTKRDAVDHAETHSTGADA